MKRILSILLSLMLMAMFYVYAVLQQDEEAQPDMRWLVQEEKKPLKIIGEVKSQDAQVLADAFGANIPVPDKVLEGLCFDASYKGQNVHRLNIIGENITIQGVTPHFAAPLIRSEGLKFTEDSSALLGFPLLKADRPNNNEYYIVTQDAAFLFKLTGEDTTPLQTLKMISPKQ
ncbi:MAG: hypothetical protein Q4E07_04360 [Eubacteriales bacterium]|nr:hypothetical protein [Eubacteriales bacterium]